MPSLLKKAQKNLGKIKQKVVTTAASMSDNRYNNAEAVEDEELEKETSVEKDPNNSLIESIVGSGSVSRRNGGNAAEMTDEAANSIKKFIKDMSKASSGKQLGVGAACGWVSGYIAMKVGKAAATAIGGSLILLQIAHYKGYVKINWNQLTSDSQNIAEQVRDKLAINTKTGVQKFQDFAKDNVFLASGYAGGFLLGMASS